MRKEPRDIPKDMVRPPAPPAPPRPITECTAVPEGWREVMQAMLDRDNARGFCGCISWSREAEQEYETGQCPHQRAARLLAAAPQPAGEVVSLTVDTAPIGTKAPAIMGGHWLRVERGWQWNGGTRYPGGTFPRPGGDWNGKLIEPHDTAPSAPAGVEDLAEGNLELFDAIRKAFEDASPRWSDAHDNPMLHKIDWHERGRIASQVFAVVARRISAPEGGPQAPTTITPEREAMSRMKDAAIEAHRLCYEAMLAHPEVATLGDDGELHRAIHAIVGVETPSYVPPQDAIPHDTEGLAAEVVKVIVKHTRYPAHHFHQAAAEIASRLFASSQTSDPARNHELAGEIMFSGPITVSDLAQKLSMKASDVVKALFKMGVMATITQTIDHDTAACVAESFGRKVSPVRNDVQDIDSIALEAARQCTPEGDPQGRAKMQCAIAESINSMQAGEKQMLGRMIEGDFSTNRVTFEMGGDFELRAGMYRIQRINGGK